MTANDAEVSQGAGAGENPPEMVAAEAQVSGFDEEARTLEVVITTGAPDRQGDILESAGLDFSAYLRNPVVLWAHDMQRPPVGRILRIAQHGDAVEAVVEFADTPFAREVYRLYCGDYLSAWSLGFIPRRWRRLPASEGGGYHIYEAEVVEVSAVAVPANAQALTKALEHLHETATDAATDAQELPQALVERGTRTLERLISRACRRAARSVCSNY